MVTLVSKVQNARDLREIKTIIGWQLKQNSERGMTKIDQSTYIKDLLEEVDCNVIVTRPYGHGFILDFIT